MSEMDFFSLERCPLDWEKPGPEDHLDLLVREPLETEKIPTLPNSEYLGPELFSDEDAYETIFSFQRIPLDSSIVAGRHQPLVLPTKIAPPNISEPEKGLMKGTRQRNLAEIARSLVQSGHFRNIDGCLYQFYAPCWRMRLLEDVENYLRGEVTNIFPEIVDYLSNSNLKEVYRLLRGLLPKERRVSLVQHNQYYLCCLDGVYRISDGKILQPDPGLDLFSCLNLRASEIGQGDGYYTELFLENATNGDPALRARLLEMVAVILTAMPLKKFFFLEGPGDTGKSQLIEFLRHLLGESACYSLPSINDLAGRWTTGGLVDKLMCSCPDIPDVTLREKPISIIKQIVGDDPVPGELKGINPFRFDCYTKLVFASNAPLKNPYHKGESAFLNRMIYIPFHNSVPDDKKVPQLYRHLLDEAEYFVGLALEQREKFIRRKNIFTDLPDSEFMREAVQLPADEQRIASFVGVCCELDSEAITKADDLYAAFCDYDSFFINAPIERSRFGRLLQQGPYQLKKKRTSDCRYVCGIRLKNQHP